MKRIPIVAVCLALSGLSSANAAPQVNTIWQSDCGQWVTSRTSGNSALNERFVLGLLDGLSLGHMVEFWNAHGPISPDAAYLWLDNYCKAHPLDNMDHATITLYMERSGWTGK